MSHHEHHRKLERLYASAPITNWYQSSIRVSDGEAEVQLTVRDDFHHAAHAVHGSVYFRVLDDAAFFAVNSRVTEALVLTASFTVHFARPVTTGELRAVGRLLHGGSRLFFAESHLWNERGELLAHGSGVFARTAISLNASVGYA